MVELFPCLEANGIGLGCLYYCGKDRSWLPMAVPNLDLCTYSSTVHARVEGNDIEGTNALFSTWMMKHKDTEVPRRIHLGQCSV